MSYSGEICQDCGFPVAFFTRSWWGAPDDLWLAVVGPGGVILCPPCFTDRCRAVGKQVHYEAVVGI